MKVFVSHSFRPEDAWVADYAIPLIRHLGHEPVTGRILGGGGMPDEVRRRMRACNSVVCFVTRA